MIYIFSLPISPKWEYKENRLIKYVSKERKEKIESYLFEIDKKLSLYGALLVRMQISNMLKIPNSKINFSYTSNKKPILMDNPNFYFNISHTKNMVLCGIANESVGVDVELNANAPFEVMKTVFHIDEIRYIECANNEYEKSRRFFDIWTKKEAYSKCLGIGLSNNISSINIYNESVFQNIYTWDENGYICSLFSTDLDKTYMYCKMSEEDIYEYFCGNKESFDKKNTSRI